MWAVSVVGRGGHVFLATGGVLLAVRARWRALAALVMAVALAWLMADVLVKPMVGRERPFVQTPTVRVIGGAPDDGSFPSGHATCSFAAALVLALTAPEARAIWWTLAITVAYSRVYLGVHFPLDVIGGAALGMGCAALALAIMKRFAAGGETQ